MKNLKAIIDLVLLLIMTPIFLILYLAWYVLPFVVAIYVWFHVNEFILRQVS